MKHEQFERLRQVAAELLAFPTRLSPPTLEWARQMLTARNARPPAPPAFQQQRIVAAMACHPPEGLLAAEIRQAAELEPKKCAVTLCYMARHGQVAMLKIPGRSRYFTDSTALEQGRALVEAAERRLSAPKGKPRPVPAPKSIPPARPTPAPRQGPAKPVSSRRREVNVMPREQGVYSQAMLPPHVHIESLPCGRDLRFTALPPIEGIGAVRDWAALTAPARGRRR